MRMTGIVAPQKSGKNDFKESFQMYNIAGRSAGKRE